MDQPIKIEDPGKNDQGLQHNTREPAAGSILQVKPFELMVMTRPDFFFWEIHYLKALLEAGLEKLHLRKPKDNPRKMHRMLRKLSPDWHDRLVLHGDTSLAPEYGISQVHYSHPACKKMRESMIAPKEKLPFSTSLHHWEELDQVRTGLIPGQGDLLKYVMISPLFENISRKGVKTMANKRLLKRPEGVIPCKTVGLGGINADNIRQLVENGWDGAAMLGWIWEEPRHVVRRFLQLQQTVKDCQALLSARENKVTV